MDKNKFLLYLVKHNEGDWDATFESIKNKTFPDKEEMDEIAEGTKTKFITILDTEYPESIKLQCNRPPFVLFYEGDISLLEREDSIAVLTSDSLSAQDTETLKLLNSLKDNVLIMNSNEELNKTMSKTKHKKIIVCPKLDKKYLEYADLVIAENDYDMDMEYFNTIPLLNHSRIIASLARDVIFFSFKREGVPMQVLNNALSQGKDIYAVPHSPLDKEDKTNMLIYEGAMPVYDKESFKEILRKD